MPHVAPAQQQFTTAVHGTVFAERAAAVARLTVGDTLLLLPDPPGAEVPAVWVHAPGGDVVGHLPLQVAAWVAPFMLAGGRCRAVVASLGDHSTASWQRLVIDVHCAPGGDPSPTDEAESR
jgi:hypothetical protein